MRNIGKWVLIGMLGFAAEAGAIDGVVGPGNCNEAGFVSVLNTVDGSGGGTITFNCGNAPVTITFTSYKPISGAVTVDGNNLIIFDGGGSSAFFQIYASANATLKRLTLQHGIFLDVHALENFGTLSLDRVRVVNNASTESAVVNYGVLDVAASTFSGNAASAPPFDGGGAIDNSSGELNIASSTFNGNSAPSGGAVYSTGALTVINSTFSANSAANGGGAIYQINSGDAVLDFVTIVGNTAQFGAGIYNDGGGSNTMTVGESIVSANSTGNCDGVIASSGYNLSNDMGCGSAFTGPGDVVNVALPMQPLGNYGGPTATQPPQAGNPAIDHVPIAQCDAAFDQRGAARPFGAACDSGSVEVGGVVDDLIFADGFDGL